MSKNLTRKGLALAAIVALGTTLVAGAPASATESAKILLAPTAGTTYNTLVGAKFSLSNEIDPTIKNSGLEGKDLSKLKFLVLNGSGAKLTLDVIGAKTGAGAGDNISAASADAAADVASTYGATGASTFTSTAKAVVLSGLSLDSADAANGSNKVTVQTTTDNTDDISVTVQAWIDDNSDNKIGTTELTSVVRTISFIQPAKVTVTTSVTSAEINATTISGQVVLGNDINMKSLDGQLSIGFAKNGAAVSLDSGADISATANDNSLAALTVNSAGTALVLTNKTLGSSATIAAATYVAQAYFGTSAGDAAKLGTSSAAQAPANSAVSVDSTDVLEVTATKDVVRVSGTTDKATTVRTGYAGAIAFSSTVTWHSTDGTEQPVGAGIKVRVTLHKVALASASTFTVGSAVLTATSGDVYAYLTTAADGTVAFNGSGTGAKDDSVKVTIEAVTKTAGYTASTNSRNTLTWADTALATVAVVNTDLAGASAALKIARGASYTLHYTVRDQFSQPVTSADYRLKITASGNADFTYYTAVAAGVASQVVVDNAVSANSYNVTAQLQKLTSGAWGDVAGQTSVVAVNSNSVVAAAISGSKSSTAAVATISKALVTKDLRVDASTVTQTTIGYGATTTEKISGTVTDASGAGVAGAVVTITGAGLAFVVNDNVYTVGSATVNTGSTGAYEVEVYSTTSGKISVTVASGAVSKAVALEFSGITALAETNVLSLDVASLSQVGRSVTVTVKLVDKFGNAVDTADGAIAISVTGVGSLSAATLGTGTTGTATVQFVAGANDFGDAVITAKYTATDAAATVVTATKTLTVGVTDAQVDIVGKRVTAVASFSKGKTVGFYVDGVKKWSKTSASDADVVLNYNLKKGTHTVTVKISGGFVTTEKFIVK